MLPVVGTAWSIVAGFGDIYDGDYTEAAWSFGGVIPGFKAVRVGGKAVRVGGKLLDDGGTITKAAKSVDIGGARFAQKSFGETFSKGGLFEGRTIDDVAGSLRSGALSPKGVPIDVIVRDGNSLILNTRSSQALIRAGIPRSSWNVIDRTGQGAYEARLSGQLGRNGLDSAGTDLP